METKQISVFLENESGRLLELARELGEHGINIRALCVADTYDFGVVRMIVDDPDRAREALLAKGFTVKETVVVAVEVKDEPGGLAGVLHPLVEQEMNVEYVYSFIGKKDETAIVIIRVDEAEQAAGALKAANYKVVSPDELYKI
ncbi:MAG: amino acid-binding protein [Actinomycetota bacterium]|nr:amino acid-binding protein [Actinomycetota bacterium]